MYHNKKKCTEKSRLDAPLTEQRAVALRIWKTALEGILAYTPTCGWSDPKFGKHQVTILRASSPCGSALICQNKIRQNKQSLRTGINNQANTCDQVLSTRPVSVSKVSSADLGDSASRLLTRRQRGCHDFLLPAQDFPEQRRVSPVKDSGAGIYF